MALHAIRFEPPGRGHTVPLGLYAETIFEMAEALRSVRHVVARRLASELNMAPGESNRVVTLLVEPLAMGSLVTPVRVGPPKRELDLYPGLEDRFWATADALILGAVDGKTDSLSIAAAEHLATAGDLAREEGFGLSLASLGRAQARGTRTPRKQWNARVDLVEKASGLKGYAERRRVQSSRNRIHMIGEVVELCFKPPCFKLDTATRGRIKVAFPPSMLTKIAQLGGQHALIVADVGIDADGKPGDAVAIDATPLVHSRTIRRDWEASRGTHAGHEIWDGPEAEEYLRDLRRRSS